MWDLIVSVPDHCLSFYFAQFAFVQSTRLRTILSNKSFLEFNINLLIHHKMGQQLLKPWKGLVCVCFFFWGGGRRAGVAEAMENKRI